MFTKIIATILAFFTSIFPFLSTTQTPNVSIYHEYEHVRTVSTNIPYEVGVTTKYCITCDETITETFGFTPASENSVFIPSINLNKDFTVGAFNQSTVDGNDIVCNYTEWGEDDPVLLGHNYNSLGDIDGVKIGDYIFFTHDGITDTYIVTHSEFGIEVMNYTNIKGIETGKICLYDSNTPTLHMFTCAWHPMYGNHRWMVVAEII